MAKRNYKQETAIFNHNLTGMELIQTIKRDFNGTIIINGNLCVSYELNRERTWKWFKNGVKIKVLGDLISRGDIYLRCVEVHGNVKCRGCLDVDYMEVWGNVDCKGYINSLNVEVGKNLNCGGHVFSEHIRVLGNT